MHRMVRPRQTRRLRRVPRHDLHRQPHFCVASAHLVFVLAHVSIYMTSRDRGMDTPNVAALATGIAFFVSFVVVFYCYCFRRYPQADNQYEN